MDDTDRLEPAAGKTMTVEVRDGVPDEFNDITKDLVAIGKRIGAIGLIVSLGDPDGFERFCTGDDWADALVEAGRDLD